MTSENKDEIEIVSYTDNEMQSWVFNHLPLSIEQKLTLLKELEEEHMLNSSQDKGHCSDTKTDNPVETVLPNHCCDNP